MSHLCFISIYVSFQSDVVSMFHFCVSAEPLGGNHLWNHRGTPVETHCCTLWVSAQK